MDDDQQTKNCDAVSETFAIDPNRTYLVENRTPYNIEIDCGQRHLGIPALGTRIMDGGRLGCFSDLLIQLRQRHQIRIREHHPSRFWVTLAGSLAMLGFIALPIVIIVRFLQDGTLLNLLTGQLLSAATALTVVAGVAWFIGDYQQRERQARTEQVDGDRSLESLGLASSDGDIGLRMFNAVALLIMLVVGVVLPATWLYFGTGLHKAVSFNDGITIPEEHSAEAAWRSIQITYVVVLVTLPAMLYFLFDRIQVSSLEPQWWRDLFRLDRKLDTLADLNARYGHQLAETNGPRSSIVRGTGSKRSPIIVATVLFAVGWTLLVIPTGARDVGDETAANLAKAAADVAEEALETAQEADSTEEAAVALAETESAANAAQEFADEATGDVLSEGGGNDEDDDGGGNDDDGNAEPTSTGSPTIEQAEAQAESARAAATNAAIITEEAGSGGTFEIFDPEPSAATAAFLGAYFFSLFVALRGFSRRDLNPKMYVTMAARVAIASSIAFLVVVVTPWGESPPTIAVAFIGGVMPRPVIVATVTAPLQMLRGQGLWRGRIRRATTDEGSASQATGATDPEARSGPRRLIDQIEGSMADRRPLTTIDHVDIFERARLDAEGLGDVEALAHGKIVQLMVATRIPTARLVDWIDQAILIVHLDGPRSDKVQSSRLEALRSMGIRTATNLVSAVENNRIRAASAPGAFDKLVEIFGDVAVLETVVSTIQAETNFPFVNEWRHGRFSDSDNELKVLGPDGRLHTAHTRIEPDNDQAA